MSSRATVTVFETLLAVVAARIDLDGCLLEGNRGFMRLLGSKDPVGQGCRVAPFFIQPDFATLLHAPAGADGMIHDGLLTVGEYMGQTQSLLGRVWRQDGQLQLLAEFDIRSMEALCATTLELNRDYASAQLELAQSNLRLKQSEARLQQLVNDLTTANAERTLARAQLLQAEKLASIGFLAAGVAHEINNPIGYIHSNLRTLSGYLEALLRIIEACEHEAAPTAATSRAFSTVQALCKTLDLDFIREDIGPLLNESQAGLARISQIVQALKDFAGVDIAQPEARADPNQVIETVLTLLASKLQHCTVDRTPTPLAPVNCGASELGQILMNLLLNAAQATDADGRVSVHSGCDEKEVWIDIRDNGTGIAPDVLPHIFDPFFTTKPFGQGTGLGLAITHGLVSAHQGRIEVHSEPGHGTSIKVFLPVWQPDSLKPDPDLPAARS